MGLHLYGTSPEISGVWECKATLLGLGEVGSHVHSRQTADGTDSPKDRYIEISVGNLGTHTQPMTERQRHSKIKCWELRRMGCVAHASYRKMGRWEDKYLSIEHCPEGKWTSPRNEKNVPSEAWRWWGPIVIWKGTRKFLIFSFQQENQVAQQYRQLNFRV